MFEFAYSLSLEITHPEMDSDRISATLGMLPDIQRTAGQEIVGKRGKLLGRKAKLSHWLKHLGEKKAFWSGEVSISATITTFASGMVGHRAFFEEIKRAGGEASFSLACFNISGCSAGSLLDSKTLNACLTAGIDITLSFYDLEHTPKEILAIVPSELPENHSCEATIPS